MSAISISRGNTTRHILQCRDAPPVCLTPLFSYHSHFSTGHSLRSPRKRDGNPNRGVSALRRTGLRHPVGMSKEPLPVPIMDPAKRSKVTVDEEHGLWGFFNKERTALSTPEQDAACGMLSITKPMIDVLAKSRTLPRATMGCPRAAKQILGRLTFSMVGVRQGEESLSDRKA